MDFPGEFEGLAQVGVIQASTTWSRGFSSCKVHHLTALASWCQSVPNVEELLGLDFQECIGEIVLSRCPVERNTRADS